MNPRDHQETIIMKPSSRSSFLAAFLAVSLAAIGCASTPPVELINARTAYSRASSGPAAQVTPADLHKARVALDQAEASYAEDKNAQQTIDLAYVAERTAQIAEARAQRALAEKSSAKAAQDLAAKQGEIATQTAGTLAATREQLGAAEQAKAQQTQQAGTERAARDEADKKAAVSEEKAAASEQKAKEANEALAKLAAKEEERGMVITLSGSVLFRSNDADLLPAAQGRLDQVAQALVAKNKTVVVEGYTDSKGSQRTNMSLSLRRAESVRAYLVNRGFPTEKISARGMGPDRPVADNANAEGRANNRRVEIVIAAK
jgi:outer membrane protein OmpA-like peptidoglycan-associated protein